MMSDVIAYHGILPRRNPLLGFFQHSPCGTNVSSRYFQEDMMSKEELESLKALRQNPFTGQFHKGPKIYCNYHNLHRFRDDQSSLFLTSEEEEPSKLGTSSPDGSLSDAKEFLVVEEPKKETRSLVRSLSLRAPSNRDKRIRRNLSQPSIRVTGIDAPLLRKGSTHSDDDEPKPRFYSLTTDGGEFEEVIVSDSSSDDDGNRWCVNRAVSVTDKYRIDITPSGTLGKGGYSVVKLATHRLHETNFALKIIRKKMLVSEEEKCMVKREVQIHQVLLHPNIIRLHEIFEDSTRLFLVLEMATGGSLEEFLLKNGGRLDESHTRCFAKQMLDAVDYLHSTGVLQGDLKPCNILLSRVHDHNTPATSVLSDLSRVQIKICDFGLSRKVPSVKYYKRTGDVHKVPYTSMRGTMGYIAPEILKKESYTVAADMWSIGVILYEMLGGILPFVPYADCLTLPVEFPPSVFGIVSTSAIDIVEGLLVVEPSNRLTCKAAISHEWLEALL